MDQLYGQWFLLSKQRPGFPGGWDCKEFTYIVGDLGSFPGLEKGMAIRSSILAWKNPWGQSSLAGHRTGVARVGHDWATNTWTHTHTHTHTAKTSITWKKSTPGASSELKLLNVKSITRSCLTLETPWTVACQAPLSMGLYWSGCHILLQEIFQTQGSNPCLLHWQAGSLLQSLGCPDHSLDNFNRKGN